MPAHILALICAAPTMLSIAGVAVPIDALKSAPHVAVEIVRRAPPKQIAKDALPIVNSFAAAFIPVPCLGLALQIMGLGLGKSRPMTPEEERLWWARAQGVQ